MPLLQIRNLPEDLYEELSLIAEEEKRSIPQETIVLLQRALNLETERKLRRKRVLEEIQKNSVPKGEGFPDPVDFLREDRDR